MKINKLISDYASRAGELDPAEALNILIELYIDNCGVSKGERTLAENASFYWRERLGEAMPEVMQCQCFDDVMELLSERFRANKDEITKYDIAWIEPKYLEEECLDFLEFYEDKKLRIAMCAGIIYFIKKYS